MTTTEFLKQNGIKNAAKLTEKERKSICTYMLSMRNMEWEGGSPIAKNEARQLNVEIYGRER